MWKIIVIIFIVEIIMSLAAGVCVACGHYGTAVVLALLILVSAVADAALFIACMARKY